MFFSFIFSVALDKKDDIMSMDADKFDSIIPEVETFHQFVEKPREQVADAEALLDIANTLVAAFRSEKNGVTPLDRLFYINDDARELSDRMPLHQLLWLS
ncbi:uncharacterized protein A4U43_C05F24000 [Asparagus officinalis]|uniref:Non-structural maintenance of chromosomes element 4 n=1 Tax=Asparagus officinalis TaxID=4686 RepID=A0A5P1EU10_ASPOF|nr:uncharacterized protein A4U43_C05F24000 [Asparagus officinalis]